VENNNKMGTGQNTKKPKITVDNGENKNWKGQKEKLKEGKTTRSLKRNSINEMNKNFENHFYGAWIYGEFLFFFYGLLPVNSVSFVLKERFLNL
jgi:hypothetical protein